MIRKLTLSSLAALTLFAVSCSDEEKTIEEVVQAEPQKDEHAFKVDESTGKVQFEAEIVYFDFDDHTLTKEGMERLNALADYMQKNADVAIKIAGHCDARGSTEYNLALGQRRADSVKTFLLTLGVDEKRLDSVSFGEEKPAKDGEGETSWAQNRRAEFTFVNQPEQLASKQKELKAESSDQAGDSAASKPAVTEEEQAPALVPASTDAE